MLFSQMALGRIAAEFVKRYPQVRLDITTEDRAVDLVEEGYDLVIRVNPDPDERLVGRVLIRDRLAAVAHPDLPLPAMGETAPAVFRPSSDATGWDLVTPRGEIRITVDPVLRLGALTMVRDAVRAAPARRCCPSRWLPTISGRAHWCRGEMQRRRPSRYGSVPVATAAQLKGVGAARPAQGILPRGSGGGAGRLRRRGPLTARSGLRPLHNQDFAT